MVVALEDDKHSKMKFIASESISLTNNLKTRVLQLEIKFIGAYFFVNSYKKHRIKMGIVMNECNKTSIMCYNEFYYNLGKKQVLANYIKQWGYWTTIDEKYGAKSLENVKTNYSLLFFYKE